MCRGENFGLQLHLEPKSHSPPCPWNQRTRTQSEFEPWNPFTSQGSIVQKDLVLTSLDHKWSSLKVLQLTLAPAGLLHTFHWPLKKPLNLVQQTRWIWGTITSPIFSAGNFSTNKPFLISNPYVLSFDLLKHWACELWFGNILSSVISTELLTMCLWLHLSSPGLIMNLG